MSVESTRTVARRAVADAVLNVGVVEDAPYNNSGAAVETYLSSVGLGAGEPWCAAFIFYRLARAAIEVGAVLPHDVLRMSDKGAASSWYQWGVSQGLFTRATAHILPWRGDLCVFEVEGGIHHIGFVLSSGGGGIQTVEGNTHPEGVATRDGYGVFVRERAFDSFGARGGFIRLPF